MRKDFPTVIETERLWLKPPTFDDAPAVNAAVAESFVELQPWMPWAAEPNTMEMTEDFCRNSEALWNAGDEMRVLGWRKSDQQLVVSGGLARIDWSVPRMEIGYWCRTSYVGQGYVSEMTRALARTAFDQLGAVRVEVRMDDRNERSWAVAERTGFRLEALLKNDARANDGSLRNTRIYVMFDSAELA